LLPLLFRGAVRSQAHRAIFDLMRLALPFLAASGKNMYVPLLMRQLVEYGQLTPEQQTWFHAYMCWSSSGQPNSAQGSDAHLEESQVRHRIFAG